MAQYQWNPGSIIWSGENPFMRLRTDEGGDDLTRVSFFRVVYSPAGEGHAAFIVSDLAGDGFEEDISAVFTDNMELGAWLTDNIMRNPYWQERHLSLIDAAFSYHGDTRSFRTERIDSMDYTIELKWEMLDQPVAVDIRAENASEMDLYSLLIPANHAEVIVNGQKAAGDTFLSEMGDQAISSCCLAFSETWIRLPQDAE